jgi:DNA-binding NtrC family response regulator
MARILIVDDEAAFREGLAEALGDLGHVAIEAGSLDAGLHRLRTEGVAAAIVDLRLGSDDGLDFLRRAAAVAPGLPCIMLTAFANGRNTIEAMKLGAFDHLTKPIGRDKLADTLARALQRGAPASPVTSAADDDAQDDDLVGASEAMRQVHKRIGMAAASESTVLVLGETGTGKELVARALHRNGPRARGPFVGVNCAAIPAELMESELFGHVKGAFSGATADRTGRFREAEGGTLFLDEVGDMAPPLQAKMLRALQERAVTPVGGTRAVPVDVRIVAATHRDLPAMVREGRFREDLWYRLQVIPIHLPPLRERPGDVALLAEHFLRQRTGASGKTLSPAALRRLIAHPWPGNVRELRNAMERALVWSHGRVIDSADLELQADGLDTRDGHGTASGDHAAGEGDPSIPWDGPLAEAVDALERAMVTRALREAGGNRAEAARRLGLHRQQLYRKLEQFGIK